MRIIFAGGGTGGHLYPGLAIARALKKADPRVEPFFIGAKRGIERDVLPQLGWAFELLDLHPLYRSRPWENWKTIRGAMSAWRRIGGEVRSEPPACVVGTGGYASGLTLGYAVAHHIPIVLQEQNTAPGMTTRFFSRFAAQVHLGFPEARRHISPSKHTEVFDSGNPIEPPPADAFEKEPARVKFRAYISPMSEAYRAADFALSRAGAMATAELCAWGIPVIVVPLPTAAADHQTANAKALAAAGAAEMIRQSDLNTESLSRTVESMLSDPAKLSTMRAKALERARPTAAADIAQHILRLVEREQKRR